MFHLRKSFAGALTGTLLLSTATVQAGGRNVPVEEPGGRGQLEQRVQNLERTLQGQGLLDMYQQLQRLQNEVNSLRGQLEVNNNELNKLRSKQQDLYNDLNSRLRSRNTDQGTEANSLEEPPLETISPGTSIDAAGEEAQSSLTVENIERQESEETPLAEAEDVQSESTQNPDPIKAQAEYQQAFKLLKEAKYDQSIAAFDAFVGKYPDSQYADNALYWMAEAFYVQRNFESAITEYMKLVSDYPDSQKTPNSLLKIGYSFFEVGKDEDAKQVLEELMQRFPDSAAASDAENRLQRAASN